MPVDRAATSLTRDLVGDDEIIILMLRPSLLYVPLASLSGLLMVAVVTLALAYLAVTVSWVGWTGPQAFGLGLGLAALRLGWQMLEWHSRVYVLTDRRVIWRAGVLRVIIFQAALKNIQHTSIFASLRERLCGLGSIGFATAGSDTFESFWVMIRQPYAVHRLVVETMQRYGR